jgi:hypothetical protein
MAEINPAIEAELAALRETVQSLREQLETLSHAVAAARGRVKLTMRSQTRCPGCAGIDLLHATEILDGGEASGRNPMSVAKKGVFRDRPIGRFEAYVCTGCGLVEWYCDTTDVEPDGENVRAVRGANTSGTGPYQ